MEKCNGWSNRETWLVNLWFGDIFLADGEAGLTLNEEYMQEIVESHLADILGGSGNGDAGFIRDMMCVGAINWPELVKSFSE